jgi:hypothetical protein
MAVDAWYGRAFAVGGAAAALVPALWMWGFTVDDALISLRYAHHVAGGIGYRFDAGGPATDGVTPLPWPLLLAPLARGHSLVAALWRAKVVGVFAWTLAAGALGRAVATAAVDDRRAKVHATIALAAVALAFPLGAWAASGMETGVATALATMAAVSFERPRRAAAWAGLATAMRPELVPWALVVAAGAALAPSLERRDRALRDVTVSAIVAFAPFVVCTVTRLAFFGRPAPLALLAKPSDFAHGVVYASAASVVVLLPILAFAPLALARASARAKTLTVAFLVHLVVVVAVGGDWMPYARLFVPVAPSLALAFVDLARVASVRWTMFRAFVACAIGVMLLVRAAPAGRHVDGDRAALIERAAPVLSSSHVVAALDVGWVGAATDGSIVDLAGLTDPTIAVLAGGHTSKAVDLAMLLDRGVDTLVLYSEPRAVEQRLLRSRIFDDKFELQTTLPLGGRGQSYRIYRRRR